jgi:hypothetical protein
LHENTGLTREVKQSVEVLVEIITVVERGTGFVVGFGKILNLLAKWVAPILVAAAAVWAIMNKKWPL